MTEPRIGSLGELLDQLRAAVEADGAEVSVGELMEAVGRRSFAPVLLLVGLLLVSPLSGIPSFPTLMALLVTLVSVQMLLGRRHFWLPGWLLRRRVDGRRLLRVLAWLDRPARSTDRMLRPRLLPLVRERIARLMAALCLLLGLALPVTELVPFSASTAGVAFLAFGLSLVTFDGALALAAMLLFAMTLAGLALLWS